MCIFVHFQQKENVFIAFENVKSFLFVIRYDAHIYTCILIPTPLFIYLSIIKVTNVYKECFIIYSTWSFIDIKRFLMFFVQYYTTSVLQPFLSLKKMNTVSHLHIWYIRMLYIFLIGLQPAFRVGQCRIVIFFALNSIYSHLQSLGRQSRVFLIILKRF